MKDKQSLYGVLAALTTNFIFGFSFIFEKIALRAAHPLIILSVRFTVAFLVLNLMMAFGIFRVNYRKKPLGKLFLMALAQPFIYFICELYGVDLVPSALAGIIMSLCPVCVVLYSVVFSGEKPSLLQIICTVLSVGGVVAVSVMSDSDGNGTNIPFGVLLLGGAIVAAAAFNLLSRDISRDFSPFERTYAMFFMATVGFNALAVGVLNKNYVSELSRAFSSTDFLLAIAYLAVLSSVVAFLSFNFATSRISAVQTSSFSNITTVVSILAGVLLMNEKMSVWQLILCVPIILGVWGVNLPKKQ